MSEDKIKRRRFLADILFAGGAISLAALLAQASRSSSSPAPVAPPSTPTPEPMVQGEMVLPQTSPTPPMVTPAEPQVKGKVALPQSRPKNKP